MIKDTINNANTYCTLSEGIKEGLTWINKNNLKELADGKYQLSGKNYVNIQTYETKDDALFEAHKEYIDIQYMITGREKCGITQYSKTKTAVEYDNDKDIEFLKSENNEYVSLNENEFLILFPQDAHKPAIKIDENMCVKKAVVKIHI